MRPFYDTQNCICGVTVVLSKLFSCKEPFSTGAVFFTVKEIL